MIDVKGSNADRAVAREVMSGTPQKHTTPFARDSLL